MSLKLAVLILLVVLIILIFARKYERTPERLTGKEEPPIWPHSPLLLPLPKTMGELTALEQVKTLNDMLGNDGNGSNGDSEQRAKENEYIKNLPRSKDCEDNYEACPIWASRGECIINPEYMLYNCASSCEACALSDQDKYNVTYIYNNREPAGCVYHGEDYPGVHRYLHNLYML